MACSCPFLTSFESNSRQVACTTFGCNGNSGRQKKVEKDYTWCKEWGWSDVKKLVTCNETTIGCCG
ncbi:hypothetical protein [Lysinibacillus fusiformis]|uniref:Uncharacterized protein n=1 Tax=Lysinibacillus fusiformis TaxID=28031 RepID=A0A1E4R9T7_9BACI|nr:hypothetical protein [Lysinibacillus fusiformis]ODV57226.1 hypothetical protein BG258_15580 [Lysinibacillus fusiformis]